jgi:class 3 adenylate cyclase
MELAAEKKKSDVLLANILPKEVAQELKDKGFTEPTQFEAVSVLFADFVGFTRASAEMTSKQLVDTLNSCFKSFDEIAETRNLEKIKTIGDSYMCAGGLPVANSTHAHDAVAAAFDILGAMEKFNAQSVENGIPKLEVRIGIHTGPLVAGVVGTTKFAYDIWGNTVNEASRLETTSEPGKINISEETYELVKDEFACTFRGSKMAKNLGEVKMFFVDDRHQS